MFLTVNHFQTFKPDSVTPTVVLNTKARLIFGADADTSIRK